MDTRYIAHVVISLLSWRNEDYEQKKKNTGHCGTKLLFSTKLFWSASCTKKDLGVLVCSNSFPRAYMNTWTECPYNVPQT